jgi:hypothetical protein
MNMENEEVVSGFEDLDKIAPILLGVSRPVGFDDLEAKLVANWMKTAALQASLFYGVATGDLKIDVIEGEIKFITPTDKERVALSDALKRIEDMGIDFSFE